MAGAGSHRDHRLGNCDWLPIPAASGCLGAAMIDWNRRRAMTSGSPARPTGMIIIAGYLEVSLTGSP